MVSRHVVCILASLVKHSLHDDGIVGRVACQVPVVDVSAHHGAAFPPIIIALVLGRRARKNTGNHARLVSFVEEHKIVR